jgi:hypothetical protein
MLSKSCYWLRLAFVHLHEFNERNTDGAAFALQFQEIQTTQPSASARSIRRIPAASRASRENEAVWKTIVES